MNNISIKNINIKPIHNIISKNISFYKIQSTLKNI